MAFPLASLMTSDPLLPGPLKRPLQRYLELAKQYRAVAAPEEASNGASVAYYCRLFALETAASGDGSLLGNDGKKWMLALMSELEEEKKKFVNGPPSDAAAADILYECAQTEFDNAYRADHALDMTLSTAKQYRAAISLSCVANKYAGGEAPSAERLEMVQYATSRCAELVTAAKESRPPEAPVPLRGEEEEEEESPTIPSPPLPMPSPPTDSVGTAAPSSGESANAEDVSMADTTQPAAPLFPKGHTPSRADLRSAYTATNAAIAALKGGEIAGAKANIVRAMGVLVGADPAANERAMSQMLQTSQVGSAPGQSHETFLNNLFSMFGAPEATVKDPSLDA